jgi:hypothetical protein
VNRQTGIAIVAALLSGIAVSAVLIVVLSGPSVAVPGGDLDPASVSAAVHEAALALFPAANPGTPPPASADGVGAFDPKTATWHLRTRAGDPTVFSFGTPGAVPLMGDWDGDGIDTVGTYDPPTTTVTLRNANDAGPADIAFTLGQPGDAAIAGDFDGDGVDTIGSWDPATGVVTISTPSGALDSEVTLVVEGHRFFTGDRTGDGAETPAMFAPATTIVYLRYSNTTGVFDESYPWVGRRGSRSRADSAISVSSEAGRCNHVSELHCHLVRTQGFC